MGRQLRFEKAHWSCIYPRILLLLIGGFYSRLLLFSSSYFHFAHVFSTSHTSTSRFSRSTPLSLKRHNYCWRAIGLFFTCKRPKVSSVNDVTTTITVCYITDNRAKLVSSKLSVSKLSMDGRRETHCSAASSPAALGCISGPEWSVGRRTAASTVDTFKYGWARC